MQNTYYHTFPNGVKLIHRTTESEVAYIGVMVGAGTRDEHAEVNGMAHYIEHCVFKGTEHYSSRDLINKIEGVGGEINAYTTKEETTYYAAILSSHFSSTLRMIADMVIRPTFPKDETDKERQVIYDEIETYNDSPSELIYDDFEALVFDGHPLAMPILGTRKTLRYFTKKKADEFMKANYRPERMVVFVQGNLKSEKVVKEVEKLFGGLLSQRLQNEDSSTYDSCPTHVRQESDTTTTGVEPECSLSIAGEKIRIFHRHTHQAHVMLGGKAYPLGHEKQLGMYLLNNILGGGSLSSILNLSLREKHGLVYTVESTYTPLSDTGYWCVYFASEPQHREQCLSLVNEALDRLCKEPLSASALKKAKKQLRGQMAISAENQENNALGMAKQMLYFGVAPTWEETMEKIDRIEAAELQKVANEVFAKENRYLLQYV